MIDVNIAIRTWLTMPQLTLSDGTAKVNQIPVVLTTLFQSGGAFPNDNPDRIYAGHLIPGFDPNYGPGIVIRIGSGTTAGTAGGTSHPEVPLISPRMQLTTWAGVNQYQIARKLYRVAYDWMQRMTNVELGVNDQGEHVGYILSALEQVEGQDVDDPHTGFATNVSFWKLMLFEE